MYVGGSGSVVGIVHGMDGVLTENGGANDIIPQDAGNLSDQRESGTSCNQLMAMERDEDITPSTVDNDMCTQCSNVGSLEPPSVGMIFPTWEAADNYFRTYGKQQGFGVIMLSATHSRLHRRRKINAIWKCECAGKPNINRNRRQNKDAHKVGLQVSDEVGAEPMGVATSRKLRKSKKCECLAMMYASVNGDGKWVVRKTVLEHKNHNLTPGKWKQASLHSQATLKPHLRRSSANEVDVGLLVSQSHDERDGLDEQVPTFDSHMRNKNARDKRLKMLDGDANALMKYFQMMCMDNQNFYHSSRLDEMGKLQDVVWVDARCRAAYVEFGDIVCFDTTYLTDGYDLPLANFVGVNHHGQMILLGCALVSLDDVETFEWVFSSWLVGMASNAPRGILTDETATMSKALGNVMPGTKHKWFLWHILQKIPKKLGMYQENDAMTAELRDLICDSFSGDEFERRWKIVIDQYGLVENAWLTKLYEDRLMWVPIYNKDTFCAGLMSTGKIESMPSFFDGYIGKKTRLCEFVDKYCYVMEKRVETEKDADANCAKLRELATEFSAEQVFQKLYTDAKFMEVQDECKGVLYCNGRGEQQLSGSLVMHKIEDRVTYKSSADRRKSTTHHRRLYEVTFDTKTNDVWCECKMFENAGILCRHSIRVWDLHYVLEVPRKYILDRWRKDLPRKHNRVMVAYHNPSMTEEVKNFDRMMVAFEPVAVNATGNKEAEAAVMECIVMADTRVRDVLGMQHVDTSAQCAVGHISSDTNIAI